MKNQKSLIYIVNNYPVGFPTDRIKRIEDIIKKDYPQIELISIHFSQLKLKLIKESDGFILSGSNYNVSDFYKNNSLRKRYQLESKLIKKVNKTPILAICFGFHLVAYNFNGRVLRMNNIDKGDRIISLSIKKKDELIFENKIYVNIHHLDYVLPEDSHIKKNFEILSKAEIDDFRTIQYMHHIKKPIFASQFHPETHHLNYYYTNINDEKLVNKAKKNGEEIIKNFIEFCIQRDS